jgi:hypothetical protein
MVVALFVVLELLSNNVMEPLLYGQSVGLSPFAVIVAAIFWAWLWGPVGLVIATPITACLVVFSSYVPALGPLGRLLGPRPALRPHHTLYQRLLAQDVDEADAIVTRYRSERSLDEALQLLLDTLLALKRDLQAARISAEDGEHVVTGLRDLIDALRPVDDARAEKPVLLVGAPGRDPLDAVVLELARVLLRDEPLKLEVLSTNLMTGEMLAEIDAKAPAAVLVPSLPPGGLTPTRQLCLRVHARLPQLPLVAARLGDPEGEVSDRVSMLEKAGCTDVAASLAALKSTVQRIARASVRDVSSAGPALVAAG